MLVIPTNQDKPADWGKLVRDTTGSEADGMQIKLTGDLGFNTDASEVFSDIDTKLLLATVLLVLVLLGAIYRSVLVALTPLIVVFFAYTVAQGFIYVYAKSGATVSSNSTTILIVLMFGVGTDYCLLLGVAIARGVAAHRGQARRDGHGAHPLGPGDPRQRPHGHARDARPARRGLPQHVDARAGRRDRRRELAARRPHAAARAADDLRPPWLLAPAQDRRVRPRAGDRRRSPVPGGALATASCSRPGPALAVTGIVFLAGALGLTAFKVDYSTTTFFKKPVEAVEGFKLMEEAFPPGVLSPMTMLVESADGPVTPEQVEAAAQAAAGVDGVASATPTQADLDRRDDRVTLTVVLDQDPLTKSSLGIVPEIRNAVAGRAPGATVLVGRRQRDPVRLRSGDRERSEDDRAARAARDRDHPRRPAAGHRWRRWC